MTNIMLEQVRQYKVFLSNKNTSLLSAFISRKGHFSTKNYECYGTIEIQSVNYPTEFLNLQNLPTLPSI